MDDVVIQGLKTLQADHEVFYGKLRAHHWNVRGPRFLELHQLFEQMYTQAALDVDELASLVTDKTKLIIINSPQNPPARCSRRTT